jgi:uncharacterized membrane protein
MYEVIKFTHLASGIVWIGGMAIMIWAVRPAAISLFDPPLRLPFLAAVMSRFFKLVAACVFLLLGTGGAMLVGVDMKMAPKGWHAMLGIGTFMCLIFGHIYMVPFRRLKLALVQQDLPGAAAQMAKIHPMMMLNFALGWLAVGAVVIWR